MAEPRCWDIYGQLTLADAGNFLERLPPEATEEERAAAVERWYAQGYRHVWLWVGKGEEE